ncbi:uncharacterized protein K02A2.6-like [Haliotis rubra]|uniref:uncharacterized protein K02A2.6-like n=1 Tax=Haliotis rubra TaxID=36100 RepID=UPI001EE52963|nr:uncharacterized protein K02A2.6-like [Haliotis rubra]
MDESSTQSHSGEVVEQHVNMVLTSKPMSDAKMEELRQATMSDSELRMAIQLTKYGWPDYLSDMPELTTQYFKVRTDLSTANNLLMYRNRIVIPRSMRDSVMESIHIGHQGVTKCTERARTCVWWPGVVNDIKDRIARCTFCICNRPTQQREPLITTPLPQLPWMKIAADLCHINGQNFLVVTDYFSRFIEIAHLTNISSQQVIGKMKAMFARWGIPGEVLSDNGTQFLSEEFKKFAQQYNFHHTTSSPHYPQANGAAESAVKIAKRLLMQDDPYLALLSYRSTPIEATGSSPAEMMIGRKLRTTLPITRDNLVPQWSDLDRVQSKDDKMKKRYEQQYNRRHSTRPLPGLTPGTTVRVKLDSEKQWSTHRVSSSLATSLAEVTMWRHHKASTAEIDATSRSTNQGPRNRFHQMTQLPVLCHRTVFQLKMTRP